eukprot:3359783-Amphidinium_carterae.5
MASQLIQHSSPHPSSGCFPGCKEPRFFWGPTKPISQCAQVPQRPSAFSPDCHPVPHLFGRWPANGTSKSSLRMALGPFALDLTRQPAQKFGAWPKN